MKKTVLYEIVSFSSQETIEAGRFFSTRLAKPELITFCGDLGSGKTTFIKGAASHLCGIPLEEITSPTFTYMQLYPGKSPVCHFDLYRLQDETAFIKLGFMEYLESPYMTLVEWSERITQLLPANRTEVELKYLSENARSIVISSIECL